jgi:hypothetical protein
VQIAKGSTALGILQSGRRATFLSGLRIGQHRPHLAAEETRQHFDAREQVEAGGDASPAPRAIQPQSK